MDQRKWRMENQAGLLFFQWVSRPETETLMIYWFDAGKNIGGEAIYTKN